MKYLLDQKTDWNTVIAEVYTQVMQQWHLKMRVMFTRVVWKE